MRRLRIGRCVLLNLLSACSGILITIPEAVNKSVELFNSARVDRVIHTGDITQAKTLDVFARLEMPLYGVFGNNDQERDTLDEAIARHGFQFIEPPLSLVWAERRIVVRAALRGGERTLGPDRPVPSDRFSS